MKILVAYASKHGATREMAERIGSTLHECGGEVAVASVAEPVDLTGVEAVVICSAVYYGRWLKAAADFVQRHAGELRTLKVWLCSSGPLGGRDLPDAHEMTEFASSLRSIAAVTFPGALGREGLSVGERLMIKGVRAPFGDFRDWEAIEAWTLSVAERLDLRVLATSGASRGWWT